MQPVETAVTFWENFRYLVPTLYSDRVSSLHRFLWFSPWNSAQCLLMGNPWDPDAHVIHFIDKKASWVPAPIHDPACPQLHLMPKPMLRVQYIQGLSPQGWPCHTAHWAIYLLFTHLTEPEVSLPNVLGSILGCDPDQPGIQEEAPMSLLLKRLTRGPALHMSYPERKFEYTGTQQDGLQGE